MTAITINSTQRLFVINSGHGYSCLGFDVVFGYIAELVNRIAKAGRVIPVAAPQVAEIGTMKQYEDYQTLMATYRTLNDNATWFDANTPAKVRSVLEQYRKSGEKVRIFLGDAKTGRDWMETYDTIGTIGRSMGPMKVALLIPEGDCGGGALLTACIVRMVDMASGKEVYRHKSYHQPKVDLVALTEGDGYADREGKFVNLVSEGYTHAVAVEDSEGKMARHANFKSLPDAAHWLAFVSGKSHDYPLED